MLELQDMEIAVHGLRSRQKNSVAACVRLQPHNPEDESRDEQPQRNRCAYMVNVCEFSSQILLLQTTRRGGWQCREIICNVFESVTRVLLKSTPHFLSVYFSLT